MGATDSTKRYEIMRLINPLNVLSITHDVGEEAARIFQDLRKRNQRIGHRDILIAATAITHNLPMLTENKKDFSRVTGLTLL